MSSPSRPIPYRKPVELPPKQQPAPQRLATDEEAFEERPAPPPPPSNAPTTPDEAERRFWARYGPQLGLPGGKKPTTVEEWMAVATRLRDVLTPMAERLADAEDAIRALRKLLS